MKNTEKLREAIRLYEFYSKPAYKSSDAPCTVGDLNKMIQNTARLLRQFVDELENP